MVSTEEPEEIPGAGAGAISFPTEVASGGAATETGEASGETPETTTTYGSN